LVVKATKQQTIEACVKVAKVMPRWRLEKEDASAGTIEGIATTKIFKFKDDFVVRVEEAGGPDKCRIDMRSRSRMGKGDLGANAKRISEYMKKVAGTSGLETDWLPLEGDKASAP
jgi:uncharacterized protein (DUF1499 family)